MQGAFVRQKLRAGQRVYGTHVVSIGNPFTAQLTAALDLDFVFICTEHIALDRNEAAMMCRFYAAHAIAPIVRIAYPCPRLAAMYLDAGAQGIVAPYVETVEEVRAVVGAVRYRPIKGEFLGQFLAGSRQPRPALQTFLDRFNRDNFLIIGIESLTAVQRLNKLIAEDGVDGVFLGPHDLSCSMELPEQYEHPEFIATLVDVIRRCRGAGKGVGVHTDLTTPASRPYHEAGINFMLHSADVARMRDVMKADLARLRASHGDTYSRDPVGPDPVRLCGDGGAGESRP